MSARPRAEWGGVDAGARAEASRLRIARRHGVAADLGAQRGRAARPLALAGAALVATVLALLLGAGAHGGGRSAVLVAARDLPAGTLLAPGDLRRATLSASSSQLRTLVTAGAERSTLGDTITAPLERGEPVPRAVLAAGDPAAFTLTVGAEHALGGALAPGDRISVLATFATASGGALTRVLARGLLVLAVGAPPDIGDPSEETVPVTVALTDPAIASGLALANTVAHVDLLRDGAGTADASIPAATAPGVGV